MVSHPVTSVPSVPGTSLSHFRLQVCLCTRANVIVKLLNLHRFSQSVGCLLHYTRKIDFLLLGLVINVTGGQTTAHAGSHSIDSNKT